MKKSIKGIIFSLIFCAGVSQFAPLTASALWNPPSTPTCNAVYLVNADTGKVVYEKNQNEKIYPASITKIMTAVLVYEKYKDKLDTTVTVEKGDLTPLYGTYGSTVPLITGEKLTIENLLYCLLVRSGDDSANVLARVTGGSVDNFVDMMNKKAKEIGMKDTHYANPHGLQNTDHYTTAYDVYLLERYSMKIEKLAQIVDTANYVLPADNKSARRSFTNTNWVINPSYTVSYYQYVKGIKTGTTTPAGACLASYAEKDGVTYYCVAMGGKKSAAGNSAFLETKALYKWVFSDFAITQIVKPTDIVSNPVNLELVSGKTEMSLVPQTYLNVLLPTSYSPSEIRRKPHVPKSIEAPITKGQKIGYEDVFLLNSNTKKLEKVGTVNLVASESAERSTPLYVLSLIKKFFGSIWFKLVAVLLVALLVLYVTLSVYINRRKNMINKRRRKRKYNYRR